MKKHKDVVCGEYSATEYEVLKNGQPIHSAGNALGDSTMIVPAERGVGLRTMRKFCINTTKQLAKENKAIYGGVDRIKEREE